MSSAKDNASWPAEAPETFKVRFDLSNGEVVAEFHKDWSPLGVQRMYDLVKAGFFKEARFFRVVPGFVVQFGIAADPAMDAQWKDKNIQDEPVKEGNTRGRISFAKTNMPNTRSTQLFINLGNNSRLDGMGFSAIGEVIEGMDVVDRIDSEYGQRPDQGAIHRQGNEYLKANFPNMDYIKTATLEK